MTTRPQPRQTANVSNTRANQQPARDSERGRIGTGENATATWCLAAGQADRSLSGWRPRPRQGLRKRPFAGPLNPSGHPGRGGGVFASGAMPKTHNHPTSLLRSVPGSQPPHAQSSAAAIAYGAGFALSSGIQIGSMAGSPLSRRPRAGTGQSAAMATNRGLAGGSQSRSPGSSPQPIDTGSWRRSPSRKASSRKADQESSALLGRVAASQGGFRAASKTARNVKPSIGRHQEDIAAALRSGLGALLQARFHPRSHPTSGFRLPCTCYRQNQASSRHHHSFLFSSRALLGLRYPTFRVESSSFVGAIGLPDFATFPRQFRSVSHFKG